jgi:hypothetical protein
MLNVAAYSPSRALRHITAVDLTKRLSSPDENSLAFESTVQNELVQSWLLGLYSKRAIARDRHQSGDEYARSLDRLRRPLRLLYDESVSFEVEIEPSFQPRLKAFGQDLDFSQLPDGVRSTVGWIADFMMRQDLSSGIPSSGTSGRVCSCSMKWMLISILSGSASSCPPCGRRSRTCRSLVTSHSPFVISSCPNSRVHVLELDQTGVPTRGRQSIPRSASLSLPR